ncbi:MAG: fumarate hydratase, partial [Candidatus Odinarchaeia archaeon]
MLTDLNLVNMIKKMIKKAVVELPEDVEQALKNAYVKEKNDTAKTILSAILKNLQLAKKLQRPICQDTGVPIFYVLIGKNFPYKFNLEDTITKAIKEATDEIPLRPNSVNPLTHQNTGDNTGRFIPYIHCEIVDGSDLKVVYLPKGAGSENQSRLLMLNPSEDFESIKEKILKIIVESVAQSCPPVIIGIGIGGGADISLYLAKKALLR